MDSTCAAFCRNAAARERWKTHREIQRADWLALFGKLL
jgi:hypothetical protein